MLQRRIFFGIIIGLLAANLVAGIAIIVMRANGTYDPAHPAALQSGDANAALPVPTSAPVVGKDIPPPNPLRDGGPALSIMRILPVIMLIMSIIVVLWSRSRKQAAQSSTTEQNIS